MAIVRLTASADTTITNAFKPGLQTRATGSNMGQADSLEAFYIYGRASSSSAEIARILIQFPVEEFTTRRNAGTLPASGSVDFYLKLYNVEHPWTLPRDFNMVVAPVSQSWSEGYGTDLDSKLQSGTANWESASSGVAWTSDGGDYLDTPRYEQYFSGGTENLEVNVSYLVEEWLNGNISNNGVGVFLSSSFETGSDSFYTKRFSARGTEYFFSRPLIEARWDNSKLDRRGNFYASSTLAPAADNLNTIYLYNRIRGTLKDIPIIGTGELYVDLYTSASGGEKLNSTAVTGGWSETGIYTATFALDTSASVFYDRWYSGSYAYYTGAVTVDSDSEVTGWPGQDGYVTTITNLKHSYTRQEQVRFRVFTRKSNWSPNNYNVVQSTVPPEAIEEAHYRVVRLIDGVEAVPYDTGSSKGTRLSYDVSGSYFDVNMNHLERDYAYGIKLLYKVQDDYREQPELFRFRVE